MMSLCLLYLFKRKPILTLINIALFSFVCSIFASVSIAALFHIGSICLSVFYLLDRRKIFLGTSLKLLMALSFLVTLSAAYFSYRYSDLGVLMKSKYLIGGILAVPLFDYALKELSPRNWKILGYCLLGTLVIAFIGSMLKLFIFPDLPLFKLHGHRIGGGTGTMKFGYNAALMGSIAAGSLFMNKFKGNKFIIIFLVFCILSMLFAQTRGAILGFFFALIALFAMKNIRNLLFSFLATMLLVGSFLFFSPKFKNSKFRLLLPLNTRSNLLRVSYWKTACYIIKEKPLFGIGTDQFFHQVNSYKKKYNIPFYGVKEKMNTHNTFLEAFVSWGVIGGGLFLFWLLCWLKESLRSRYRFLFVPFIVCTLTAGQFQVLTAGVSYFLLMGVFSFFVAIDKNKKVEVYFD